MVVLVDISDNSTLPVRNLFTVSLIVIHSRVVLWPIFVTAIYAEFIFVILTILCKMAKRPDFRTFFGSSPT